MPQTVRTRSQAADSEAMEHTPSSADYGRGEPMIGIKGLAAWLDDSHHVVRKWVQAGPASGRVPRMYRINGQIRFRPADVEVWLESRVVE